MEPPLLLPNAFRSEHDPDGAAVAADHIAMHSITGAFTDPSHESAFAAQLFRLTFSIHAILMALSLAVSLSKRRFPSQSVVAR